MAIFDTTDPDTFVWRELHRECLRLRLLLSEKQRAAFDTVWCDGLQTMEDTRCAYRRMTTLLRRDERLVAA